MRSPISPLTPRPPALSDHDQAALTDLYVRGTPENTLRAYERDLIYLTAWKAARLQQALTWPETPDTALLFVLDHSRDLIAAPADDPARRAAQALIAQGLRRSLACPAPATLDRRIASWRAFHRMRDLPSPFEAPQVRQARAKGRRANARPRAPKSSNPITRDVLEQILAAIPPGLRGMRDRALLMTGWASGGRRRSELVALQVQDLDLRQYDEQGLVWLSLPGTKTTTQGQTPRLVLKGRAARALVAWLDASQLTPDQAQGPLFRPISKSGRPLPRALSPDAVGHILKRCLQAAELPADYASPHGLRSGFLTQAALDGAPLQAAMRLSLHRSMAQAAQYYDDVDPALNPATDLLD